MLKLIATDLDGTLLNSDKTFSKDFDKIIKTLKEHNIKFAIASGRPLYTIKRDFGHLSDDIIFISDNGALITYKETTIYSNYLEKPEINEIIKIYKSLDNIHIILCGKDCAYIESTDEKFLTEVDKYYSKKEIVSNISSVKKDILKVTFCSFDNIYKITNENFSPILKDKLQLTISGDIWLDIMDKSCTKGNALRKIQNKYVITNGETMAFGDYYNDIEMFNHAYYSYAMENAPEDVKAKAKHVIGSNDDNAVIDTIKNFIPNIFKH